MAIVAADETARRLFHHFTAIDCFEGKRGKWIVESGKWDVSPVWKQCKSDRLQKYAADQSAAAATAAVVVVIVVVVACHIALEDARPVCAAFARRCKNDDNSVSQPGQGWPVVPVVVHDATIYMHAWSMTV